VVTTIDAASLEMDEAPTECIDIVKGPQFLDSAKFPKIVFRSERVRVTGEKSMEISGTPGPSRSDTRDHSHCHL